MQDIVDDDGFEDVEFEMSVRARYRYSRMIAHDLCADHGEGFTLGWVDLSGHDRGAGLVGWQGNFADPRSRAGAEQADVVGDFHERYGQRVERAGGFYQCVVGGQGFEFIFGGDKGQAGDFSDLRGEFYVKSDACVDAGADSRSALGELIKARQGVFYTGDTIFDLFGVAGEFLA